MHIAFNEQPSIEHEAARDAEAFGAVDLELDEAILAMVKGGCGGGGKGGGKKKKKK